MDIGYVEARDKWVGTPYGWRISPLLYGGKPYHMKERIFFDETTRKEGSCYRLIEG
jgi:hypothetical protein